MSNKFDFLKCSNENKELLAQYKEYNEFRLLLVDFVESEGVKSLSETSHSSEFFPKPLVRGSIFVASVRAGNIK